MSGFTKDGGTSSEELALIVHEGVQEFCRLFQTSQFDKMAQFYAPDTTLMLPHRPVIRGADKLPVLFRELKEAGLHDWRIEPNRITLVLASGGIVKKPKRKPFAGGK